MPGLHTEALAETGIAEAGSARQVSRGKTAAQLLGALVAESTRRHPLKRQIVLCDLDHAWCAQRPRLSQPLQAGGLKRVLALADIGARLDKSLLPVQRRTCQASLMSPPPTRRGSLEPAGRLMRVRPRSPPPHADSGDRSSRSRPAQAACT